MVPPAGFVLPEGFVPPPPGFVEPSPTSAAAEAEEEAGDVIEVPNLPGINANMRAALQPGPGMTGMTAQSLDILAALQLQSGGGSLRSSMELIQNGPPTDPAAEAICENAAPSTEEQFDNCLAANPSHPMPNVWCDGFVRYNA